MCRGEYAAPWGVAKDLQRVTILAANGLRTPLRMPYLRGMKVLPRYAKLPISTPLTIVALGVLMLVLGLQGGLTSLYAHLYLLIGSYVTWGLMLPFFQGMVEEVSFKRPRTIVWMVSMMVELMVIHFLVSNVLNYTLQWLFSDSFVLPTWAEIQTFVFPSLLARLVDFVMFFGLLSWVNQSQNLSAQSMQLLAVEAQLQKSRLETLKNQLNPHFLFNTLHTIAAMIGTHDDKARDITIKISTLLRKTLQANQKAEHSLGEELALMGEYLDIEQERFHDRLTVDQQVDSACLVATVPTLCLQPILENAFKHGIGLVEGPARLGLMVVAKGNEVEITVTNSYQADAKPLVPSTGIGLQNLRERLAIHYGEGFSLAYVPQGDVFRTTLSIPMA